jgi:hypothetical protein
MKRTTNHIVRETEEAHESLQGALPAGTVVVAANGTGDLLVLPPDGDQPAWWDHETGELHPVETGW